MDVKYREKIYVKVAYRKLQNLKKKLKVTTITNSALKKTNTELVKKIQDLKEMLKVTENKCEILMAEQAQTLSSAQLIQGKFLQLISKIYEAISINAFNDGMPLIPHFPSFTFPANNNENVSRAPNTASAVGASFASSGSGYRPINNINHILSPISENDATGSPVQRNDLQVNSTSPNVTSTSDINNVNPTPEGVEQMTNERTEDVAQSSLSIAYVKTVPPDHSLKRELEELTEQASIHDTDDLPLTVIDETCQENLQTQPSPSASTCSKQGTITNVKDNIPNFSNVEPSTLDIPASLSICSKQETQMNVNDSIPNFINVVPRRRKALSPQSQISPQTPTSPPPQILPQPSVSTQPQIFSLPSTSSRNIENETAQDSSLSITLQKKNNFRPITVKIEGSEVNDEVLHAARESSFDISGNFKITSTPSTSRITSVCPLVTGSLSTSSQRASRMPTNPINTELTGSPSGQSTGAKRKLNTGPEQSASEDEPIVTPKQSDIPLITRITRNSKSLSPDKSRSQSSPRSGRRWKKSPKQNSKTSSFSSTLSNESNGPRSRRAKKVNYKEPPCNRKLRRT